MPEPTVYEYFLSRGYSRRDFLKLCAAAAGALGLQAAPFVSATGRPLRNGLVVDRVALALQSSPRVPVVWLELQDCAGCTEAITRSSAPTMVDLIFDSISLDYHETLAAASGARLEAYRRQVMERYVGEYLLVVEGSVPTGADGGYCTVGGRAVDEVLVDAARHAKAVIAVGNCAAFGGIPAARPNPTGAIAVQEALAGAVVVNIPGCPAVPEVTTGTLLHMIVNGEPPELDALGRPLVYYGTTIHDRCERRPHFRRNEFAAAFDDEAAKAGWCLYELGCKGPETYNACPTLLWSGLSYPVQSGHPCLGCSQPGFWDQGFYSRQHAVYLPRVENSG